MSAQTAVADKLDFMFDRAAETMPRSELKALQLSRLKSTLERAYTKVAALQEANSTRPASSRAICKSLADLARFPFTVKTDLRDNYPFGMFAVPREQLLRLHASSGTTGKPTVVGYTKADLDLWADLMARSLRHAGARPGDIVHNAYGYGLFTGGLGAHYGAERLGCTVVPMSGGSTERQVTLLQDFGAHDPVRHAVLRAQHRRSRREHGRRHPQAAAARRHLRRRAVERGHAPRHRGAARHQGDRHLRPVGDHGAGRRLRMPADAERPARLGGSFPVRGDRSRDHAAEADGRGGRAGHHHAHQGSAADDPLPHPRHHAAVGRALRLRPHACAHHARHRPQRRHADHPRRQRLSRRRSRRCWSASREWRRTTSSC